MAEHSGIEWTDATFNPWWGCTKISPGCEHCYAESLAARYYPSRSLWGIDVARRTFGESHWKKPLQWNVKAANLGRRLRVFCASMADVFDTQAPAGLRERLWQLIRQTPNLDWLLLTKRIGNAPRMLPADWNHGYPNVWLGVSIVNQTEAARDIPKLVAAAARIRFLSCEPLLGPLHLSCLSGVHWVIAGGESGTGARRMEATWVRQCLHACKAQRVPFFFKQWGLIENNPIFIEARSRGHTCARLIAKQRDPIGHGGSLLDGRRWIELPEV